MANLEHVKIFAEGPDTWNRWRQDNYLVVPDLSHSSLCSRRNLLKFNFLSANLSYTDLTGANFGDLTNATLTRALLVGACLESAVEVDLRGACLIRAHLRNSDLRRAKLDGADLMAADLSFSNLQQASLVNADLGSAKLYKTIFNDTNLSGTSFRDAEFSGTILANVDLSVAKWLTHAKHRTPSTIGIDTLCRSRGDIPKNFLKGAGILKEVSGRFGYLLKRLPKAGAPST